MPYCEKSRPGGRKWGPQSYHSKEPNHASTTEEWGGGSQAPVGEHVPVRPRAGFPTCRTVGWPVGAALGHQVCGDWLCSRVHMFDLGPSELHTQNLLLHFFIVRACISLHWPLPCSSYAPAHRRFPLGSLCSWTVWGGFELVSVAVPPDPDPCFTPSIPIPRSRNSCSPSRLH